MEFSIPLPWKIINLFPIFFSNKVCAIRDIFKSNQIACDPRHYKGWSIFGKSEGKWGLIIGRNCYWFFSCFRPFRTVWRGLIFSSKILIIWTPASGKFHENIIFFWNPSLSGLLRFQWCYLCNNQWWSRKANKVVLIRYCIFVSKIINQHWQASKPEYTIIN